VHDALPPVHDPKYDLMPPQGLRLTPKHYAYLKISEGCNNRCSFCIIPSIRGDLVSRPAASVLYEAERLVKAGVKELLVISQDTSAYGVDTKYASSKFHGREVRAKFYDMAKELGDLGAWVRMHYVYPYPHVDDVIPLMAEGKILPYLDIPFQHAAIRSTFIVGFPGETEADFNYLLDWMKEARLERVGCFKYEPVSGAKANDLGLPQVPDELKAERYGRFMEAQQEISAELFQSKIGREIDVLVDAIDLENEEAVARSPWDAPEIDGNVFLPGETSLKPGDMVRVRIVDAEEYDLVGELV
jgi:ribosomal protein S12 methylthiotransferase